jgi:hypothetical protein
MPSLRRPRGKPFAIFRQTTISQSPEGALRDYRPRRIPTNRGVEREDERHQAEGLQDGSDIVPPEQDLPKTLLRVATGSKSAARLAERQRSAKRA